MEKCIYINSLANHYKSQTSVVSHGKAITRYADACYPKYQVSTISSLSLEQGRQTHAIILLS